MLQILSISCTSRKLLFLEWIPLRYECMPTTGQQQVIHLPDNPNFNYFLHFKKLIAGLLWVFEEKDGRNGLLLMVQQWLDLEARFPSLLY